MTAPVLELRSVGYTYQGKYQKVEALKDATACFEAGKVYAIVGRSGSGKTTLLSLMAGLDLPTAGDILAEGTSLKTLDRDRYRLQTASVIYQDFNLFPLLTALENVLYPLQLQKRPAAEARQRAMELLAQMGLPERILKQYPKMMSGGEQQRVAIARALAAGGKILLADEPTGNLDTANSEAIVELLCRLTHDSERTTILITHDPEVAAKADTVYHMEDGVLRAAP